MARLVAQTCNPSPWEVEARPSGVGGHPGLYREFQAGLACRVRSCRLWFPRAGGGGCWRSYCQRVWSSSGDDRNVLTIVIAHHWWVKKTLNIYETCKSFLNKTVYELSWLPSCSFPLASLTLRKAKCCVVWLLSCLSEVFKGCISGQQLDFSLRRAPEPSHLAVLTQSSGLRDHIRWCL